MISPAAPSKKDSGFLRRPLSSSARPGVLGEILRSPARPVRGKATEGSL